jgi:roundabout, axon guidance receptor 2
MIRCFLVSLYPFQLSQDELNSDLDLSEARASLLSGDVVELINATSVDSTSMKLLWEVSKKRTK